MKIISRARDSIFTMFNKPEPAELQQDDILPKSFVVSGGKRNRLFVDSKRTEDQLKKWWTVYASGGLYAQAVDTYARSVFANGYRFEGPDNLVKIVKDNFAAFDFDTVGMQSIIQSLIFGDSFQEVVVKRGNGNTPAGIVMRDSSTFTMDVDDYGMIKSYTQRIVDKPIVKLQSKQIIHLQIMPSSDVYGLSLIGRAYDDIMRDAKTAEASAAAIDRHGFPKWHIKVGQSGEMVEESVLTKISTEFEDIETDNEFTTTADVDIIALDQTGLDKMEDYSNVSLMRVASAMGIPEEMIGIKRGSTDATSVSRIETFLRITISGIQRTVARVYTLGYIDQIVTPGQVKLVFNDVREEDEFAKAEWIAQIISSISTSKPEVLLEVFKVFPQKWIQSQFNIQTQDVK